MTPQKRNDPIPAAVNKLMLAMFLLGMLGMGVTLYQMTPQQIRQALACQP